MGCFSGRCFGSLKHNKVSDKPSSPREEELHSNPTRQLLVSKLDRSKSEEDETRITPNDKDRSIDCNALLTKAVKEEDRSIDCNALVQTETEKGDGRKQEISEDDSEGEGNTDALEEDSYDSLFSLCIDFNNSDAGDREVSSPLKPISKSRDDTLAKCITLDSNKENACPEVNNNETAVVACSLSSWLKSSSNNTKVDHSNSPESEKNYSLPPVKLRASCTVLNEI